MALKIVKKSPPPPQPEARSRVPKPTPPPAPPARQTPPAPKPAPLPPAVGKKLAESIDEIRAMRKKVAELERFVAQKQAQEKKAKISAVEEKEIGRFLKAKGFDETKARALRAEFNNLLRARGLKPDVAGGKLVFSTVDGRTSPVTAEKLLTEAAKNRFPPVAPPQPAETSKSVANVSEKPRPESFVGTIKKEFEKSGVRTALLN